MPDLDSNLIFSASMSRSLDEASTALKEHKGSVKVVSHYDPDGITAAAIACTMIKRLGLHFQASLNKNLNEKRLETLRGSLSEKDLVIFTDMGSSHIDKLDEWPNTVIVVDHHQPGSEGEKVHHLNPHLFSIDGSREASASSFVLSLAISVDEENWNLASLAITGAIGDRQNIGGFKGYNEDLVSVAIERELVKREVIPSLKGETIYEAILENPEPYFVKITGRKRETSRFLKWMGLTKDSRYQDLDDETKRFLTSICALRLLRQGATSEAVGNLVTPRYWLYDKDMYADEFSALLNACSRQGEAATGLALALGDGAAKERALQNQTRHQDWIIENLMKLEEELPKTLEHIQYFHTTETAYAGVLAGLGALYFFDDGKATFGLSKHRGNTSVSARAARALVNSGANLGLACKEAGESVGGAGGGHDIAAGATVPSKKEKAFLKELDAIIGRQLAS